MWLLDALGIKLWWELARVDNLHSVIIYGKADATVGAFKGSQGQDPLTQIVGQGDLSLRPFTVEVNHVFGHFCYPYFGLPCKLRSELLVGGEVEEGGYL